jgi:hypothetical protein
MKKCLPPSSSSDSPKGMPWNGVDTFEYFNLSIVDFNNHTVEATNSRIVGSGEKML